MGKMFPEYFGGVENVLKYQADALSKVRLDTKRCQQFRCESTHLFWIFSRLPFCMMAINKTRVLPETREKLATGIFRWDMDLYHFIQMSK